MLKIQFQTPIKIKWSKPLEQIKKEKVIRYDAKRNKLHKLSLTLVNMDDYFYAMPYEDMPQNAIVNERDESQKKELKWDVDTHCMAYQYFLRKQSWRGFIITLFAVRIQLIYQVIQDV